MNRRGWFGSLFGLFALASNGRSKETDFKELKAFKLFKDPGMAMKHHWIRIDWNDIRSGDRILTIGDTEGMKEIMEIHVFTAQSDPSGKLGSVDVASFSDLLIDAGND